MLSFNFVLSTPALIITILVIRPAPPPLPLTNGYTIVANTAANLLTVHAAASPVVLLLVEKALQSKTSIAHHAAIDTMLKTHRTVNKPVSFCSTKKSNRHIAPENVSEPDNKLTLPTFVIMVAEATFPGITDSVPKNTTKYRKNFLKVDGFDFFTVKND